MSAQSDLQKRLSKIQDHAWEFDAKRVAEMLSAAGEGPSGTLVDSAHKTLEEKAESHWPTTGKERAWYTPLRHS